MHFVSIGGGGFADWGFGILRERNAPLFGIFGAFAKRRGVVRRSRSANPTSLHRITP
jgi:hypothetical protein